MVPLNLVLRGGTHPSRPRGSGDQRALIRRENIFPRRYRVFQANCSNTTIDYTCTFTGAKRSLSLSPLEFDDLLEKNIGGKKKGEEGINTDTKAHNGRKQNSATGVKTSNSVANEGPIRTYIYIYRVHATSLQFSHPLVRNLCVYCNFSVRFQFVNPKNSQSRKRKRERKLIRRYIQDYFEIT